MLDIALFIDPFSDHFEQDRLFDASTGALGGDNVLGAWVYLREWLGRRGVAVHTADLLVNGEVAPAKRNIYVSLGIRHRYARIARRSDVVLSAFFAFECPIVEPLLYLDLLEASRSFKRVFSFSDGESLRPFLRAPMDFEHFHLPQPFDCVHENAWSRRDRNFMVMVNANKLPRLYVNELYTERLRAIEFFNRHGEIDLYGVGWNGPPARVGSTRIPSPFRHLAFQTRERWGRMRPPSDPLRVATRHAYRGLARSKADILSGYTFAVCFENMALSGWVTEKIFDCLLVGTVPIYLGAPDIERWVSASCFIDMRRFRSYEHLREHLHSLTRADIDEYRIAGREYLASERYRPFTKHALVELFGRMIEEDADVRLDLGAALSAGQSADAVTRMAGN